MSELQREAVLERLRAERADRGHEEAEQKRADKINEYLKNPIACPFCSSQDIVPASLPELGSNTFWCEVQCHACGVAYREIFTMTGIERCEEEAA